MSAKQPIQCKGEIVYNPKTNRPIKVGSRAWLNLVKQGVIAGEYADENVLGEYNEEESKQEIKKRIKELNSKQDLGTQVVRGRGVYKGKLVKRNKALSVQDISKKTSKIASKIVVDDEDEKLEKELEMMIYQSINQSIFYFIHRIPISKTSRNTEITPITPATLIYII